MRLIGHGIDIIEISRIAGMRADHPDRFLERCFSPGERAYAESSRRCDEHLAGRFAAKEAAMKALGTGWRSGIAWTDIEVVLLPSGRPTLRLHGKAAEIAGELGITSWSVSLSHAEDYAVASVLAMG